LTSFSYLRATTFDCAILEGAALRNVTDAFTRKHLYMAAIAANLWRVPGLENINLWPLAALLFANYAAAGSALGRLFLPRSLAVLLGLALALSPLASSVLLLSLRDFAKSSVFLWAFVLMGLALSARDRCKLLAVGVGLGLVSGLGSGFRGDVALTQSLGILVVLFGTWRGPVALPGRVLAALGCFVIALPLMAPLRAEVSTAQGGRWMQGMSEPFRHRLRLAPAPYDLGERYSDELTFSGIAADLRRIDPAGYTPPRASQASTPSRCGIRVPMFCSGRRCSWPIR